MQANTINPVETLLRAQLEEVLAIRLLMLNLVRTLRLLRVGVCSYFLQSLCCQRLAAGLKASLLIATTANNQAKFAVSDESKEVA